MHLFKKLFSFKLKIDQNVKNHVFQIIKVFLPLPVSKLNNYLLTKQFTFLADNGSNLLL